MSESPLKQLSALGQSVWLDYLSRDLLRSGGLRRLMDEYAIVGVTSNPTIFQKAIAGGDAYDEQMREVGERESDPKEVFYALASQDIRDACDLLRPTWERTRHLDGYVSMEVDPNLAYDHEATVAEARSIKETIDRQNLFVKIPATEPGLGAIEDAIAAGIAVNVTLIFGLPRYREVTGAYMRGLERLRESGGDLSAVSSVASFFVSRVDTEADRRLGELGAPEELQGKLGVANAKLAYQSYKEIFAGARWEALKADGARVQRCLWASTGVKNPAYRDTFYVEELAGPETVDTMPQDTLEAFNDHGVAEPRLERDVDEAKRVFERIAEAGVDYDDVIAVLEHEGVEKFRDAFNELLENVKQKRDAFVAA